jgi:hypothetical protein
VPEAGNDVERLVREARAQLPATHRALLTQIGVQEVVLDRWPGDVQDLYRTIKKQAPSDAALADTLAVWPEGIRVVAFNGPLLLRYLGGRPGQSLSMESCQFIINGLAWHEYGHALSVTRSSSEQRRSGVRLLEQLPEQMRDSIAYPGTYLRNQVFDEVIAHVYGLMVHRLVRGDGYGPPDFLPREVFDAFKEVVPWPPNP